MRICGRCLRLFVVRDGALSAKGAAIPQPRPTAWVNGYLKFLQPQRGVICGEVLASLQAAKFAGVTPRPLAWAEEWRPVGPCDPAPKARGPSALDHGTR